MPLLQFVRPLEVLVAADPSDEWGSRSVRSKTKPAVKIVTKGDNLSGLRFSVECEKWARQRETCRASSQPLLSNKNWNDEGSVFVKTLFF